jgi:nucleotide-binding universal stress UspA family protein
MSAHAGGGSPGHARARVIVVGFAWTNASEEALALACEMARQVQKGVEVHVVRSLRGVTANDEAQPMDEAVERERLEHVCAKHGAGVVPITCHVTQERAEDAIVDLARDAKAWLVIIGADEKQGLERLISHSVTERVVRTAPCPVLVAQAPELPGDAHERVTADAVFETAGSGAVRPRAV